MTDDIEKLLSMHASAVDIQRYIVQQLAGGKDSISRDRRNDIIRSAKRVAELAETLA